MAGATQIVNGTVARNNEASAVYLDADSGASMQVRDSILFFNNSDGAQIGSNGGTPIVAFSDVQGGGNGGPDGNIDFNPVFGGVGCERADLQIVAGSLSIDGGDP